MESAWNGISQDHRDFLAAGGYGFIIGDGKLNYGSEGVMEIYYNARLTNFLWLTFDYQFVKNPGYNKDRGPVHVFGLRAHVKF
jgi:high affinity Mn2+ porin